MTCFFLKKNYVKIIAFFQEKKNIFFLKERTILLLTEFDQLTFFYIYILKVAQDATKINQRLCERSSTNQPKNK